MKQITKQMKEKNINNLYINENNQTYKNRKQRQNQTYAQKTNYKTNHTTKPIQNKTLKQIIQNKI